MPNKPTAARYSESRQRGLERLAAGHISEALDALARAVHLRPDLFEAHFDMGRAFQRAGKIEAARHEFLLAQRLDNSDGRAAAALADLPPAPPTRQDFQIGQILKGNLHGRIKVVDVKKGGFGVVYIVEDDQGKYHALKSFQARFLWSDEDRKRFEREALTWIRLDSHPNIVTLYGIEWIEGFPCLALEYLPGGDLQMLIGQGPLEPAHALKFAVQICDGLSYAHRKLGIVHRDLKPNNCLITEDGILKVTDFGLARCYAEAQNASMGLAGLGPDVESLYTTWGGTKQFMAPEQFFLGESLDARTDVYAFGVTLYHMMTCDLPSSGDIARKHILSDATSRKLIPEGILRLILRCVETEPTDRPSNFEEVRDALDESYRLLTGKAPPPRRKPTSSLSGPHFFLKGYSLEALDLYEEALESYARGLAVSPDNEHLWQRKCKVLVMLKRSEEALGSIEAALKLAPTKGYLWHSKALTLQMMRRNEDALACLDEGLRITPRDTSLWEQKGRLLDMLERREEALKCFDQGLSLDSSNEKLWISKGQTLQYAKRYEEALACFQRYIKIAPRNSDGWSELGLTLTALKRYEEAMTSFDRGQEIEPRNVAIWRHKGTAHYEQGQFEEALECYARGLEISPAEGVLWINKGLVLEKLERHQEAMRCYSRGLEVLPNDPELWLHKGHMLTFLERNEDALDCYERGLKLAPLDHRLWSDKGLLLTRMKRHKDALGCYDRALELSPKHALTWKRKGKLLGYHRRYKEAVTCFERGLEILPQDKDLLRGKTLALKKLGKLKA